MAHHDARGAPGATVVVGVDGAGRTHRLHEIAAAATAPVVRLDAGAGAGTDLDELLTTAGRDGALVVVDDAHRLPPEVMRALTAAARRGVAMVIARRPTVDTPELAELDEAVAGQGTVAQLGPLDDAAVAAMLTAATGERVPVEVAAPVREACAGLPALVAAVAAARRGDQAAGPPAARAGTNPAGVVPAGVVARVQQRLARLAPRSTGLARLLALRLGLTDPVLAAAAGLDPADLPAALRSLRDAGLLDPDGEAMVPVVAQAVLADLPPAERRRLHDAVAGALMTAGADPVTAARHLSAAQARTAAAAEVYRTAADALRFRAPAEALSWYEDAVDAGAPVGSVAAGRAEAAALLGTPVDPDLPGGATGTARLALVAGAVSAHQGRADRAAEALLAAADPGPLLAVPALVATGQPDAARQAAAGSGPVALRRLAEACLALSDSDPGGALPLLIEASEAAEAAAPDVVLPDTPHAIGAVAAVTLGDPATAEYLLEQAGAAGIGGPVAAERHRLLRAWVRMRTGRYDTALAELGRLTGAALPGRERLLVAALSAGIARRSGDVARLREAWAAAEPVLARRAVDLLALEPVEELLVAAARLRQPHRITPVADALEAIVDRLGRPPVWTVSAGWTRLHVAVAVEDAAGAADAARALAGVAAPGPRQRAQVTAAGHWARALAGEVDPDAVLAAAEALAAADLPWEASRLAGHAAIRTTDAGGARRLLERARELAGPEPGGGGAGAPARGGLSEREVEVAQLVLAGRTHKEIGAQLYVSPKTVEHHVARIRTKLGAGTRAELVAALQQLFSPDHAA